MRVSADVNPCQFLGSLSGQCEQDVQNRCVLLACAPLICWQKAAQRIHGGATVISPFHLQVEAKFQAAIASEAVQKRMEARLVEERARLEEAVADKLAAERRVQLQRKRKEQEQQLKEQVCLYALLRDPGFLWAVAAAAVVAAQAGVGIAATAADASQVHCTLRTTDVWAVHGAEGCRSPSYMIVCIDCTPKLVSIVMQACRRQSSSAF